MHCLVKDIAGAPYKIKQIRQKCTQSVASGSLKSKIKMFDVAQCIVFVAIKDGMALFLLDNTEVPKYKSVIQ